MSDHVYHGFPTREFRIEKTELSSEKVVLCVVIYARIPARQGAVTK
jgi:hypothetical protein